MPFENEEILRSILSAAVQQTKAERIEWRDSGDGQSYFYANADGVRLRIFPTDRDGQFPFSLLVENEEGSPVGQLDSIARDEDGDWVDTAWADDLAALYSLARDQTLRISRSLRAILKSLKELEP